MEISTKTTWAVGQQLYYSGIMYKVGIYKLHGIPIRCLQSQFTTIPCAIILHIIGHGDWVYFIENTENNPYEDFPRVLNNWHTFRDSTCEKTIQLQSKLVMALQQAKKITTQFQISCFKIE